MPFGDLYCHVADVDIASVGQFEAIDSIGRLVQPSRIRDQIYAQSALIQAALYKEYGDVFNSQPFWYKKPIAAPSNTNADVELAIAILPNTLGFQQITLEFLDDANYSIKGSELGVIAATQPKNSDYNVGGITILAANWTGNPSSGDKIYLLSYTVHPFLVSITAKLTAIEILWGLISNQSATEAPKSLISIRDYWRKMIDDLRDGRLELGGRRYTVVGHMLHLPRWDIDIYGQDVSKYRLEPDTYPY